MEENKKIDVIIPVYKPDEKLNRLLTRLFKQSVVPEHIILLQTIEEEGDARIIVTEEMEDKILVETIFKKNFDHGATRNYGASLSEADYIVFMTQDAVPHNMQLLEELLVPFADPKVAISYGRQLAGKESGMIEEITRSFNYPDEDAIKSEMDLEHLGIKTYFCSDVCAMYRKDLFDEMGGFVYPTIFNEDMIMASKMIKAGYLVAYAASAKVVHSHKYSCIDQFHRNFDLGVSHKQYQEVFEGISSEKEGIKLVKETLQILMARRKAYLIPEYILQTGAKYIGYRMGKLYQKLPEEWVVACSMNKGYWKKDTSMD